MCLPSSSRAEGASFLLTPSTPWRTQKVSRTSSPWRGLVFILTDGSCCIAAPFQETMGKEVRRYTAVASVGRDDKRVGAGRVAGGDEPSSHVDLPQDEPHQPQ
jgi:hypothetical protein